MKKKITFKFAFNGVYGDDCLNNYLITKRYTLNMIKYIPTTLNQPFVGTSRLQVLQTPNLKIENIFHFSPLPHCNLNLRQALWDLSVSREIDKEM